MKVVSFFWQFVLGHPLFWARFTGLQQLFATGIRFKWFHHCVSFG